jgi:hypothetical protein
MAESHVVSGLVDKRSELVGQIEKLQDEIASIRALMDCIDGSIKLFEPDYDLLMPEVFYVFYSKQLKQYRPECHPYWIKYSGADL